MLKAQNISHLARNPSLSILVRFEAVIEATSAFQHVQTLLFFYGAYHGLPNK